MPYPKELKSRTRHRILRNAARLFAARGFAATSIEEVMRESHLTRGAFYSHFLSKADLYRQAMGPGAEAPDISQAGEQESWLDDILKALQPASGLDEKAMKRCAFLATDIAHPEPEVRAAYGEALKALISRLQDRHSQQHCPDHWNLAAIAMVIGWMAIDSTVDDPGMRKAALMACRDRLVPIRIEEAVGEPAFFWALDPSTRH